jgi:hypothetical protein
MAGIKLNAEKQITFLTSECASYKTEFDELGLDGPNAVSRYFARNGVFGGMDGDVLYSFIRHYKPRRIIEIGSGWSTLLSAYALERNRQEHGIASKLIAIEPYPPPLLKTRDEDNVELVEEKLQAVDRSLFQTLEENDVLFIDSTHIVNINSDVCYEYLEILPKLNEGVLVHIHDIFLPDEYPKDLVLDRKLFWNEAYLLQAFLAFNNVFEILWGSNYMRSRHPQKCSEIFRELRGSSFWLRRSGVIETRY